MKQTTQQMAECLINKHLIYANEYFLTVDYLNDEFNYEASRYKCAKASALISATLARDAVVYSREHVTLNVESIEADIALEVLIDYYNEVIECLNSGK